jgi:hypothetical protein
MNSYHEQLGSFTRTCACGTYQLLVRFHIYILTLFLHTHMSRHSRWSTLRVHESLIRMTLCLHATIQYIYSADISCTCLGYISFSSSSSSPKPPVISSWSRCGKCKRKTLVDESRYMHTPSLAFYVSNTQRCILRRSHAQTTNIACEKSSLINTLQGT